MSINEFASKQQVTRDKYNVTAVGQFCIDLLYKCEAEWTSISFVYLITQMKLFTHFYG